eukprot:12267815-Ditylum_brightwellii.AAC.1
MKLNIKFPSASKHHKKGSSFYIPKYMHKLFDKYKKQLVDHGRMIKEKLGLAEKRLTAHFGRRSGAVVLADAGIFMPSLKQAGRWASSLTVEEYMDHSHMSKKECLTLLDKKRKAVSEKKANNIERSSAKKAKKWTIILYPVMTEMTAATTMMMITVKLTKRKKKYYQPFHPPCYATINSKKSKE